MKNINQPSFIIYQIIAFILFILVFPLLLVLFILIKLLSRGPFIFTQKRAGKNKKPFYIYKIRTMVEQAEDLKKKYLSLNEAEPPAFKIHKDPRYTKIGRIIAHLALDELPQLINVVKGEMSLVGPRPLPVDEANKIPKKYAKRFSVLPGMTSTWIVEGADHTSFKRWMEQDLDYLKKKNFWYDIKILANTFSMIFSNLIKL